MRLAILLLAAAACPAIACSTVKSSGNAGGTPSAQGGGAGGSNLFGGRVSILGQPGKGVEALLVDKQGKVLALSTADASGAWIIATPKGFAGGWVLFRATDPVVAVRAFEVGATPKNVDLSITESDTETLQGKISVPAGVTPDWVEISLTPREVEGVPDALGKAILMVDTGTSMRGAYVTRKVQKLEFEFRVTRGIYDLRVERNVEAPLGAKLSIPNMTAQAVIATDGAAVTPKLGGFLIEMYQSREVRVEMATTSGS